MNITVRRALQAGRWTLPLGIAGLLTVACSESTDASNARVRRICPDCPAVAGGESSDFGGTPHPCAEFESKAPIGAAQALALGFDVLELEQRVQREVDAPLDWTVGPSPSGARPPAGYEAATRVQLRASVEGYTHVKLDPSSCVESVCRQVDTGEQWSCSDRLELDVEAELHTGDGAVTASLAGYVTQGRPGFAFAEVPAGTLFANLRSVTGTLELFPEEGLSVQSAWLLVDWYLRADRTSGQVRTVMLLRSGEDGAREYDPLTGTWGDLD